ncbi:MAG: hypothetical protein IPI60_13800 [Saprospiraceae bacterium]|nr:hypothetical protein [Saprospiraceae bacterium]
MENKRYRKAEETLVGIKDRNKTRFEEEVTYYLVLSFIKNKKIDAAKKLLSQTIEDKSDKYFQNYTEINKELNK